MFVTVMFIQPGFHYCGLSQEPTFEGIKARVFVTVKFIQPGLIIVGQVRSLPSRGAMLKCLSLSSLSSLV